MFSIQVSNTGGRNLVAWATTISQGLCWQEAGAGSSGTGSAVRNVDVLNSVLTTKHLSPVRGVFLFAKCSMSTKQTVILMAGIPDSAWVVSPENGWSLGPTVLL